MDLERVVVASNGSCGDQRELPNQLAAWSSYAQRKLKELDDDASEDLPHPHFWPRKGAS